MSQSKHCAIRDLDCAIKHLKEARCLVECNRFRRAQDQIGDSLIFIGKAIRHINCAEKEKQHQG